MNYKKPKLDIGVLEMYDDKLIYLGNIIHEKRRLFTDIFKKIFKSYYLLISENKESVEINFKSQLNNNYKDLIKDSLERDLIFQFTTQGPHKDDLELLLNGYQIKKFGSQGQQKSLLISLKLAQYEFLKKLDIKPIVLLDDIFDKLDQKRVELIMQLIEKNILDKFLLQIQTEKSIKRNKTTNLSHKIHEIFKIINEEINFLISLIFLNSTYCNINTIDDIKDIEGMWEIYSVSSKGEVFYPQGESPVVDYYTFDSDSTGTKKKLNLISTKLFPRHLMKSILKSEKIMV